MNWLQQECKKARSLIYENVKKELLGPGSEDIGREIEYELITDDPISRYSTGILFPQQDKITQDSNSSIDLENNISKYEDEINNEILENIEFIKENNLNNDNVFENNEIDEKISMANELKPSSMGITFFAKGKTEELKLRIKAAKYRASIFKDCCVRYTGEDFFTNNELNEYIYREDEFLKLKKNLTSKDIKLYIDDENDSNEYREFINVIYALSRQCKDDVNKKNAYVREPLPIDDIIIKLDKEYVVNNIKDEFISNNGVKISYDLEVCIFTRKYSEAINSYTIVLINNEKYDKYGRDTKSIFQPEIKISSEDNPSLIFIENRDSEINSINLELDDEEQSLQLLFSKKKNYSIGHGVGTIQEIDIKTGKGYIKTSFLPYYEVKGIKFDIDGLSSEETKEILAMKNLSDYSDLSKKEIISNLEKITYFYERWIVSLEEEICDLEIRFKQAAKRHINECRICLKRMKKGIEILANNDDAYLAFNLMNRALFMQRKQALKVKEYNERFPDDEIAIPDIDFEGETVDEAIWRPFQLAYILMCLESLTDYECEDRDIVDLIWVPTGGGKTEAYLGLTAYTIFLRRIQNKNDDGTSVIMRYTLRLLAAQQFIRASILICACELIRRDNEKILGEKEITIGIWIGSAQTPNNKQKAKEMYDKLIERPQGTYDLQNKKDKYNVFQVLKCPWCGTKLEKEFVNEKGKKGFTRGEWGYEFTSKIQHMFCTDNECPFGEDDLLPIQVVDECIYENPPTLLFGTVDKFAMITWESEAAKLFALDSGNKNKSPELIIQDELHLISGPLGSIVGQYETAVDLMCSEKSIRPKIIASTATIKRAKEQCNQLYVRDVKQFPPPGLYEDDSFFTKEDKNKPGRLYVGVMPSGKTLTTTQVRLMSALTNRVKMLDIDEKVKSKYWTLVGYFNTLKELGMTSSLIQADIQDNINIVSTRLLKKFEARKIQQVAELTSRKSANEINNTLKNLEIELSDVNKQNKIYPIDILLASNMISVGVDVSRLNIMMVLQQPKLTSEYIQATSRVGRENPGIVFTLYNPSRSRDKSHYEMFFDYHQSFYKHVEPTSVTSFAESARDRMLHSVFIALVRHVAGLRAEDRASEFSIDDENIIRQYNNIINRVEKLLKRENLSEEIIEKEVLDVKEYLDNNICRIWSDKVEYMEEILKYSKSKTNNLIKPYGKEENSSAIETLQSMRNVDQEGSVSILVFGEETNE